MLLTLFSSGYAFPLSLAWEGFWRGSWTLPWLGEASAGGSLGRDLYEATNFPGSGTPKNGYTPAAFDGVNDLLVASGAAEDYFGVTGWTIHAVVKCTSLVAPGGFTADQPALFSVGPGSSAVALAFDSTGVTALQYDGIGGTAETPRIAVGTSTYRRIQARWTGTQIQCRVDGGAWQSVACTSQVAYSGTGEILRMGVNYDGTKFLAAEVLEGGVFATSLSDSDLDALDAYAVVRYGLAGITALVGYGLPARARGGVGVLSTSLALTGKGFPAPSRAGASSLALGVLPLTGQGLPTRTTAGSSAITIGGITLASKGLPASTRGGSSTLATSLALVMVGLPASRRAGASALSTSLVLSSVGLPAQLRAGSSVLSPGALAFVGVGLPSATRGGAATLTLGVSVTTLVSVGLPAQLRAGVATLSLGPVALAGQGLPTTTRGGSSTSTPGALALASKGLPARSSGGANALAASFSVSAKGLPASPRGGTSALALGPMALAGVGLPASTRGGVSSASPGPLTLASKGLPAQLRAGVAASLPVFVVAARGLPARARGGASALALGGTTLALVGLPARTSCGVGLLELGGRSLVAIGLPASTRGGVGMLSVRAANQAGTVAIDLVPRALVAIAGAPRADVTLDLSPRALVALVTESPMSQPYRFDLGDDAVFTATYKLSETGELSDPTTLEVTVTPPTAPAFVVAYPAATLERKGLGVYRLSVDCNEVGVWRAHFRSTGPAKAGEPVAWTVR